MSDDTENKTRKPLPTTKRGRASQLPLGTGIGITGMTSGERYLMSGADAQNAKNIIALFEAIKGRKATDEERADVERKLKES
jgi:hypothetical protein